MPKQENQNQPEKERSKLLNYAKNNRSNDFLADVIFAATQDQSRQKNTVVKSQPEHDKTHKSSISIIGADEFGIKNELISAMANTLPGAWLSKIQLGCRNHPVHVANSAGQQAFCSFKVLDSGLMELEVFYPLSHKDGLVDMLSGALAQAHAQFYYPNRLSTEASQTIDRALRDLQTGYFHDDWKFAKTHNHLPKKYYQNGKNAVLWASILRSLFRLEEPGNTQESIAQTLASTQHLSQKDSEILAQALQEYFNEIAPDYDFYEAAVQFRKIEQDMRSALLASGILEIFSNLKDKGMKRFFTTWLNDLDQTPQAHQGLALENGHVPSLKAGMALDDARELGVNIAESLRVSNHNPRDIRRNGANLTANIRRFNDIWNTLDKKEQKNIRPKIMRVIHASIV